MIYDTLNFLTVEVNNYLNNKIPNPIPEPRLKMGNVSRALDDSLSGVFSLKDKAIITLVNVEEDRAARQQENYVKGEVKTIYRKPPLYLNLYVLVSITRDDYKDSLIWLSTIMQFFQHQNVFTPITHPSLKAEKLIVDMHNLTFEQINHLWSTLGGKYLPSVLYKIRQITLDEELTTGESGFIKEIDLEGKSKSTISA
jgi:hypothetical protein